ncbi:mucin-5AC-like isoform X5 [Eriocheir sinensis]|uniref:mucin-5AC-like isoform X5 n=1 Tax=Eriocheir sinensis TaxID=95602 RepID=UPI0021C6DDA4|nr:mucin-5AC-like isoform X5 [Eriocheir sinensis]
MLSMCGLLCSVLRGWRHNQAVILMARALSQTNSSILVQDLTAGSGSGTGQGGAVSAFCVAEGERGLSQLLWCDNNKQAIIVSPRQCVDLQRWTLFLSTGTPNRPHRPGSNGTTTAGRAEEDGVGVGEGAAATITVLLEATYRERDEEVQPEYHVMVEQLSQPYAWKARDVFGVIVTTTPPQLLAMIQAFFNNALHIDDDFLIKKIITIEVVGEPASLADPLSIPECSTPGHWSVGPGALTQLELARSLSPSGAQGSVGGGPRTPGNSLCPPALWGLLRHQSSGESATSTSTTLHPQSSTDSERHQSSLDPQSSYDSVSDYLTSDTDDLACNVSGLYPRGWAVSGAHVVSGQPLSVRAALSQLQQPGQSCSIVTNPLEDLWQQEEGKAGRAADDGCVGRQSVACLNGPSSGSGQVRSKTLPRVKKSCGHPHTCLPGSVICQGMGIQPPHPGKKERDLVREAAQYYQRALDAAQVRREGPTRDPSSASDDDFSFNGSRDEAVVTQEPLRYPVRIRSEADLTRATSIIRDNLANIIQNYLFKPAMSPESQPLVSRLALEQPTIKLLGTEGAAEARLSTSGSSESKEGSSPPPLVLAGVGQAKPLSLAPLHKPTLQHQPAPKARASSPVSVQLACLPSPYQKPEAVTELPHVTKKEKKPFTKSSGRASARGDKRLTKTEEIVLPPFIRGSHIDVPITAEEDLVTRSSSSSATSNHPESFPHHELINTTTTSSDSRDENTHDAAMRKQVKGVGKAQEILVTSAPGVRLVPRPQDSDTSSETDTISSTDTAVDKRPDITAMDAAFRADLEAGKSPAPLLAALASISHGQTTDPKINGIPDIAMIPPTPDTDTDSGAGTVMTSVTLDTDTDSTPGTVMTSVSVDTDRSPTPSDRETAAPTPDTKKMQEDTEGTPMQTSRDMLDADKSSGPTGQDKTEAPDGIMAAPGLGKQGEVCTRVVAPGEKGEGAAREGARSPGAVVTIVHDGCISPIMENNGLSWNGSSPASEGQAEACQRPRCLKDTHKLNTKSSTASESSFESLPYRMLTSQPESLTDDLAAAIAIELTRPPPETERLRAARLELIRQERIHAISLMSTVTTDSEEGQAWATALEQQLPATSPTVENGAQETWESPMVDSGVELGGLQEACVEYSSKPQQPCSPTSPMESAPESGFSSLRETVPEGSGRGGRGGVCLSKSKDSLDLTDADRCPGTDTLSDDMETLSSSAGEATLMESGPVSRRASPRNSVGDSQSGGGSPKELESSGGGQLAEEKASRCLSDDSSEYRMKTSESLSSEDTVVSRPSLDDHGPKHESQGSLEDLLETPEGGAGQPPQALAPAREEELEKGILEALNGYGSVEDRWEPHYTWPPGPSFMSQSLHLSIADKLRLLSESEEEAHIRTQARGIRTKRAMSATATATTLGQAARASQAHTHLRVEADGIPPPGPRPSTTRGSMAQARQTKPHGRRRSDQLSPTAATTHTTGPAHCQPTEKTHSSAPVHGQATEKTHSSAPVHSQSTEKTPSSAPAHGQATEKTHSSAPAHGQATEKTHSSAPAHGQATEKTHSSAPAHGQATKKTHSSAPAHGQATKKTHSSAPAHGQSNGTKTHSTAPTHEGATAPVTAPTPTPTTTPPAPPSRKQQPNNRQTVVVECGDALPPKDIPPATHFPPTPTSASPPLLHHHQMSTATTVTTTTTTTIATEAHITTDVKSGKLVRPSKASHATRNEKNKEVQDIESPTIVTDSLEGADGKPRLQRTPHLDRVDTSASPTTNRSPTPPVHFPLLGSKSESTCLAQKTSPPQLPPKRNGRFEIVNRTLQDTAARPAMASAEDLGQTPKVSDKAKWGRGLRDGRRGGSEEAPAKTHSPNLRKYGSEELSRATPDSQGSSTSKSYLDADLSSVGSFQGAGGSLELLEGCQKGRWSPHTRASVTTAHSQELTRCEQVSLKSEGSLDKFPHFDQVSASQRPGVPRRKGVSVDDSGSGHGGEHMHRSLTLPGSFSSPRKDEKKRDKEEKGKKKKKEKEAVAGGEKKSAMMSLKGLLRRKSKEKEKESTSQEKLSSPSLFRRLERRSKSGSPSPLSDSRHPRQGNNSPSSSPVDPALRSPVVANGKTRPVISSPVALQQAAPLTAAPASTTTTTATPASAPPATAAPSRGSGVSCSDSESAPSSTPASPQRRVSLARCGGLAGQPSPRLYKHVLTRNLSSSQESLDSSILSSAQSSPQSSPHGSPQRCVIPQSASSLSLPAGREHSPPAPVMGTRALRGSSSSFSVTIGFRPRVERRRGQRTVSEGADLNRVSLSPGPRRGTGEGSRVLTQLGKRSSSMEILVCGKIREHCPEPGGSPGGPPGGPRMPFSREGSFRLHREISVETLFEVPEGARAGGSSEDYRRYLDRVQAARHGSSSSLVEEPRPAPEATPRHRPRKYSVPQGMHLSGMREAAMSNPNLQRAGSPLVRGMTHSSTFSASPLRRPTSATPAFSPAKRSLSSAGGGSQGNELGGGGGGGVPLMRVDEEGPARKNLDASTDKPPNILVYAANNAEYYVKVQQTIALCVNPDRYIIYHLTDELAFKSPWSGSTTLLVVCGDVPAHISTVFIRYLLKGGRVLSVCSDFLNMAVPLFAFELPWTSSLVASGTVEVQEQAVVSVSYQRWSSVHLLHHQHCFHSSPRNKRFSRINDTPPLPDKDPAATTSRSAVSVEPTHVEIIDEYGGLHRLDLRVLAKDDTWGAPTLLAAKVHGGQGIGVFSQVHLEHDPQSSLPVASEASSQLAGSNTSRLEILRELLASELNLDTSLHPLVTYTPAYFLGRHQLKEELLSQLRPHLVGEELQRSHLSIQFVMPGCVPKRPAENLLPILTSACPLTFSTVKYFETLNTTSIGRLVIYCDVVSSSMRVVAGNPPLVHGLVVIPTQQTHGQGRSGNMWLSPLGCAMFSIQLHLSLSSQLGQHLSFLQHLVAMAVVQAVVTLPGYADIPLRLKWPNDIYLGSDVKIGGVVVEATTLGPQVIVNIGSGINLSNSNPTGCLNDAIRQHNQEHNTCLEELEREVFLARVFNALESLIHTFQNRGPGAVQHLYYRHWLHSNAVVTVQSEHRHTQSAVVIGIDSYGFLQARLATGETITLQPDGNSFNMMEGLVYSKVK